MVVGVGSGSGVGVAVGVGVGVEVAAGALPSSAQAEATIAATMSITRIRIKLLRVISLVRETGKRTWVIRRPGLRELYGSLNANVNVNGPWAFQNLEGPRDRSV